MRRMLRVRSLVGAMVLCATPISVAAEPILVIVTSGAPFTFRPDVGLGGHIELFGTEGFSLVGGTFFGNTAPRCCLTPGSTTAFRGFWTGGDVSATVTFRGDTFTHVGSAGSVNHARIAVESSVFTLPSDGPSSITVTAPFTLTGAFRGNPGAGIPVPGGGPPIADLAFIGSGIGTLPFTRATFSGQSFWSPGAATLQLSTPVEPIPEPGSLLLLGLGLAGAYAGRRRRTPPSRRLPDLK
jgi:hypothetical protein